MLAILVKNFLKVTVTTILLCQVFGLHAQKDSIDLYNLTLEELMNVSVYSASKKQQRLAEAPAIMTVVRKSDIEKMGVTTLIDVLKFVPGIEVSLAADGHYRLSMRGNRKDGNVLLLINGQQFNDSYTGRAILDLSSAMIDRVEIIRGPGSALFGTNAVAGVVHVFLSEGTFVELFGGINNTVGGHINYEFEKNNIKLVAQAGYIADEAGPAFIETDASDREGNDWDLVLDSLSFKTTRSKQDGYLNFNMDIGKLNLYSSSILRTRSDWAGSQFVVAPGSEYKINQHIIGASYEYQANDYIVIVPRLYASHITRNNLRQETPANYVSNFSGDLFPEGRQTKESYLAKTYGAELDLYIKVNEHLNLLTGNVFEDLSLQNYNIERNYKIVGDSYMQAFGNYDQVELSQDGKKRFVFAYFLQADYNWKRLNLTMGLRYDDYSDFGSSFNPRVGMNYKLTEQLRLKGLYGKAFRAPTFQELYDNTTLGNQYGISGNQLLKPETIETYELALEYQRKKMVFRYNSYYNINKNLIRVYDPHGGGSIGVFQNTGSTNTIGHEFEALVDIGKRLQFFANFSQFLSTFKWNDSTASNADVIYFQKQDPYYKQLFNIPTIRVNAGLTLSLKKWTMFAGLNYGSSAKNNHRFYLETGSFVEIPSYFQGNMMICYKLNKSWKIKLALNNLGSKYVDPDESTNIDVYGNKGLIQPGMSAVGSIQFKIH